MNDLQVLVADDDAMSRLILQNTLEDWGYTVVTAEDGEAAWKILKQPDAPRILILDWMMPGMDGVELCRRVRSANNSPYMYIILLTGKTEKEDVQQGINAGADDFLPKPVDENNLRNRLTAARRLVQHQQFTPAPAQPVDLNSMATRVQGGGFQKILGVSPAEAPRFEGIRDEEIPAPLVAGMADLNEETMLTRAPRVRVGGLRITPSLGGIPLLSKLGEGGMGAVYRGYHTRLQQEVAVKVLAGSFTKEEDQMRTTRFYREAQIAARVKSPHLVSVLDINEEQRTVFMVMELVHGTSSAALLKILRQTTGRGLSESEALDVCIAATKGLAAAHENSVIHRDIKPDNILIPRDPQTHKDAFEQSKLSDLGIARYESGHEGLTMTHSSLGTVGFMAPEQVRDAKNAGKPADIFSMGVTLYALMTGHTPFAGTSPFAVFDTTINKPHRPIHELLPDVSAPTASLIDQCLSKAPEDRFPDANALLMALQRRRGSTAATVVVPKSGKSSATMPATPGSDPKFDCFGFPIKDAFKPDEK